MRLNLNLFRCRPLFRFWHLDELEASYHYVESVELDMTFFDILTNQEMNETDQLAKDDPDQKDHLLNLDPESHYNIQYFNV